MANRSFQQFHYSLEKAPVELYMSVAIGSTGAPTLSVANSKGIRSIARNGVGKYTITLQDNYVKFLMMAGIVQNASGIPAGVSMGLFGAPAVTTVTGGTIVIQFSTGGSATELASGDTLFINMVLGNSTAV